MYIRHGSLAIDLPDDWRDESTLLFASPARKPAMLTANPVTLTGEAVSIRFALSGKVTIQELLDEQQAAHAQLDPTFRTIAEEPFRSGLGQGVLREQETNAGGFAVRQLVFGVKVGPVLIVATASAPATEIDTARPRLRTILASLRAEA